MGDNVKIVPASCTQCGGTVEVDPQSEKGVCPFCGTSFIIEKAINNYNVQHATIEHADNVNIDMTGSVKSVLDFVGDQMKESRAERREYKKIQAEKDRQMTSLFFKMMGIMFAGVFAFGIIGFIYYQITGGGDDTNAPVSSETAGEVISPELDEPVVSDGVTRAGEDSIEVYFEWDEISGADGYQVYEDYKYYEEEEYREPEYYETTETAFVAGAQDYFDFRISVRAYKGQGESRVYSEWSDFAQGSTY